MKDNYDLSKMQRVPHPLAGKIKLVSNLGRLSDVKFEQMLLKMQPDERIIAKEIRRLRTIESSSYEDEPLSSQHTLLVGELQKTYSSPAQQAYE